MIMVSRQLWWGHQIPARYSSKLAKMYVGEEAPEGEGTRCRRRTDTWFSRFMAFLNKWGWLDEKAEDFQRYSLTHRPWLRAMTSSSSALRMIFQSLATVALGQSVLV